MEDYLIVCPTLTRAQRTAEMLGNRGIAARVVRSPQQLWGEGCSHSVRISWPWLDGSLELLTEAGLRPRRVFSLRDGILREVPL